MTRELLRTMLEVQHKLNVTTNGKDYLDTGICDATGKKLEFELALYGEINEFSECVNYEHWKKRIEDVDIHNALLELVDIVHLELSNILLKTYNSSIKPNIKKEHPDNPLTDEEREKAVIKNYNLTIENAVEDSSIGNSYEVETINPEDIIKQGALALFKRRDIYLGNGIVIAKKIFDELVEYIPGHMNFKNTYMAKCGLNILRAENGYSTGEYKKHWATVDGLVEDNVFATKIAEKTLSKGLDVYLEKLRSVYSTIKTTEFSEREIKDMIG